ncbi:MAG: gluconate:H+ symporter [Eubacteriales bacterium]
MEEILFAPEPARVLMAGGLGIGLLLLLIIKFKISPVLSLLAGALTIGLVAGMPTTLLMETVETGAGETLKGIVLLIGLGSMLGGILESTGGTKQVAQTLISRFGEKNAGLALGFTGLIVGTAVFFEAGVMILMPVAVGLARRTKKSVLLYAIPLFAGLATAFAFIPPSAGSVMVANILGVDLGVMIMVGVPVGILSLLLGGVLWSKFIGARIVPDVGIDSLTISKEAEKLPTFGTVLGVILTPLVLILLSTVASYLTLPQPVAMVMSFIGTPFVALLIAIFVASYFLGIRNGHTASDVRHMMDKSLRSVAGIILVITGGGIISQVLQTCGIGNIVGGALEQSGLPLVVAAFLIAGVIRISVGAAPVPMTMTAGIMMAMPAVANLNSVEMAALVLAISGGSSAFSHFNDSGFWMVTSVVGMAEKDTLKSWTVMGTIVGFTGLICALLITAIF